MYYHLHSTATKELVDKYEMKCQHFMTSTTVNQFRQLFPALITLSKQSADFKVMVNPYWGDNIVGDLTSLVGLFGIPRSYLHLVQKG